jgi:hypothetical protein
VIIRDNVVIGDNNKCCATSCSSNSIEHVYLWCTIRNDCSFDSNRVEYSLAVRHISPRIRSQAGSNDYTLYVRNTADATCNHVILANNNKYCASSSCGSNGISYFSLLVLHHQEQSISTQSGVEYELNGTAYQSSNSFAGLTRVIIHYMLGS